MSSKRLGRRRNVGGLKHLGPQVRRGQGDGPRLPQAPRCLWRWWRSFTDESITSLKKEKGSPMEACLASRAIGLLTITVGNGSTAIEIMEQSLPHLEKVISSESEALKISVLLTPTHLAIVMEYAAGDKLFDRILMAGRFSEDEARYFFQQLISGVSYCHLMVHQDCERVGGRSPIGDSELERVSLL